MKVLVSELSNLYLLIKDCCKNLKKKRVEKQLKDDQESDYRVMLKKENAINYQPIVFSVKK